MKRGEGLNNSIGDGGPGVGHKGIHVRMERTYKLYATKTEQHPNEEKPKTNKWG